MELFATPVCSAFCPDHTGLIFKYLEREARKGKAVCYISRNLSISPCNGKCLPFLIDVSGAMEGKFIFDVGLESSIALCTLLG